jgi:hypothetical protein
MSEYGKTNVEDIYIVPLTIVSWVNLFDREVYKQ